MQATEAERLKIYEKIQEMKNQIKEEDTNAIEKGKEPVHKKPKEKFYENDVLGMVYITSNELQFLPSQKMHEVHNFV
jgi:hypothetical protein